MKKLFLVFSTVLFLTAFLAASANGVSRSNSTQDQNETLAASSQFTGEVGDTIHTLEPHWNTPVSAKYDSPNILIIMLDDVGFADLGAFGSEIQTPNIDELAANGLLYNNFTTTAVCSPSRAALLTGLNHHSAGVGWLANMDTGFPGYRGEIHPNAITLPEVLKENGYSTMMIGKWHLINSDHLSSIGPFDAWPTQRGFERYWGFLDGEANQWMPAYLYSGNELIEVPQDGSFYFPDAMTDMAIQMLKDHRATSRTKPFFLYYSTGAAHAPHHTKPEDRAKYFGAYEQGYDAVRAARLARQRELGIVPANTQLTGYYPGVTNWDELSADDQKVSKRLQENYAAFIDNTDQQIGRLVRYLKEAGEIENTIIVLLSDNGASKETSIQGTTMATRYLHGIPDSTEKNLEDYDMIGGPETHPNYPLGWMQVSNTPFQYAKATTHGGGVRDPLIIHWPAKITDKGAIRRQFHHINDLMPTVLEAVGVKMPTSYKGLTPKPLEGVSMLYSFQDGEAPDEKTEQYYELAGNRAYVSDSWKIVTYVPRGQSYDSVPWELYNLREDFSESNNLADKYPDKVKELEKKWFAAAKRYDVLPIDDRPIMEKGRGAMALIENVRYRHFEYEPGMSTIHNIQAPILTGRSFSITAKIDGFKEAQEGVLVALGGYDVGYSLFVQEGRLHYETNIGGYRTKLYSSGKLPSGQVEVQVHFAIGKAGHDTAHKQQTDGDFSAHELPQGELTLLVNGKVVGSKHFAPPVPFNVWEGLDIGRDLRTPVSKAYSSPFKFQGELVNVIFEIH